MTSCFQDQTLYIFIEHPPDLEYIYPKIVLVALKAIVLSSLVYLPMREGENRNETKRS